MIVLATDSSSWRCSFSCRACSSGRASPQGTAEHLKDRLLRLGLPFVVCALTVIHLAYYAISLRQHPAIGLF
jgi:hypothetical protein